MTTLAALSQAACAQQDELLARAVEQQLQDKYGEQFVVEKIGAGWGGSDDSVVKVRCRPDGDSSLHFNAEIKKDRGVVRDDYLNAIAGRRLQQELAPVAKGLDDEAFVFVQITTPDFPEGANKDFKLADYLNKHSEARVTSVFFVRASEAPESGRAREIAFDLADQIGERLDRATVAVFFVKEEEFADVKRLVEARGDEAWGEYDTPERAFALARAGVVGGRADRSSLSTEGAVYRYEN